MAHTVGRFQRNRCIALADDLRNLNTRLDNAAIGLHLLDKGVRNHGSVKISVVLGIACAEDIVRVDVGKDLLDAVLVGDILTAVAGSLCKCNARLDT